MPTNQSCHLGVPEESKSSSSTTPLITSLEPCGVMLTAFVKMTLKNVVCFKSLSVVHGREFHASDPFVKAHRSINKNQSKPQVFLSRPSNHSRSHSYGADWSDLQSIVHTWLLLVIRSPQAAPITWCTGTLHRGLTVLIFGRSSSLANWFHSSLLHLQMMCPCPKTNWATVGDCQTTNLGWSWSSNVRDVMQ